jgi:transposase
LPVNNIYKTTKTCYTGDMDEATKQRIRTMLPLLNERQRRLFLASEAKALGFGGISDVSRISAVSRVTITLGLKELEDTGAVLSRDSRCRRPGGGRKSIKAHYPDIIHELKELLEPYTKGDPENPLQYTSRSTRNIERALREKGFSVSDTAIAALLKDQGYSLQGNRKELATAKSHPDRDAQFEYINKKVRGHIKRGEAVLSIDAKKKELIGDFHNKGKEYHEKGAAPLVYDHDFLVKELGKAAPYGVYDVFRNHGFVNIGLSSDTAEFAVESLNRWWDLVGYKHYKDTKRILITADCGGSNGYKVYLWKVKLQELANRLGKEITVMHFPPGTSKWNKIEHRLFSFISKNWRGKPLISAAVIINLISAVKTDTGLSVECILDNNTYRTGIKVTEEEYNAINIKRHKFHREMELYDFPSKIIVNVICNQFHSS